jgi:hypothetical protein
MSVEEQYTSEVRRELGYLAAWLPTTPLSLGDYGYLDGATFRREGNISVFGVDYEPLGAGVSADIRYQSSKGVDLTFQGKADGQIIPDIPAGHAGVKIAFSKDSAVVLVTDDASEQPFSDVASVQTQILALEDPKALHEKVVISSIVTAEGTSVLVSRSSTGELTVGAKADLSGLGDLAKASVDLKVRREREMSTTILAQPGLTPLLRAFRVRRWGFQGPGFQPEGVAAGPVQQEDAGFEWLSEPMTA